jgi:hypothetical protein
LVASGCQAASATALESNEHVERVATRDGTSVPVLVVAPQAPKAIVLLFPGGDGKLGLTAKGIANGADNFVVRTRHLFAQHGMVAIVVDVPSDHADGITAFRESKAHADDIAKIITWARSRWPLPVALVGTSRGTISAANAAARGVAIDRLVLTSSVTAGEREKLGDLPLDKISAPSLVIHHEHDGCEASPLAGAKHLAGKLDARWRVFHGGDRPTGAPCSPESHHGFLGLDRGVVAEIAEFILK